MSTPPPYPQQPYPQQYPAYPPPKRRTALPWLVGGAVVVIAALAVTLVLVLGGDDDGGSASASGGTGYDLSTPEKAAESIAAAARAGDVEAFLELTCVGNPACLDEQGKGASQEDIADLRDRIESGLEEFAGQLESAEFGDATQTSLPGVWEVPYQTPDMAEGEFRGLTFVEVDGKWLWYGSSGGSGGSSGGGGQGGGASAPTETPRETSSEVPTTTFSCPPPPTVTGPLPVPSIPGC